MTEHHARPDELDALRDLVADLDIEIHPAAGYEMNTPARYVVVVGPEDYRSDGTRTVIEQRATAAYITAKVDGWRAEAGQAAEFFATTRPPGLPAERVARRGAIYADYQSERARLETELANLDAEHAGTAARLDREDTVILLDLRNQALEDAFGPEAAELPPATPREAEAREQRATADRAKRLTAAAAMRGLQLHRSEYQDWANVGPGQIPDHKEILWTLRAPASHPAIGAWLTAGDYTNHPVTGDLVRTPTPDRPVNGLHTIPFCGPDLESIERYLTDPTAPTSE